MPYPIIQDFSLVGRILELNKKFDIAKLCNEKEMIQRLINKTGTQINRSCG